MAQDNSSAHTVAATDGPRTRRHLLVGALGGLGAWAAATMARPQLGRAAPGDPVMLGADNESGDPTTIRLNSNPASAQVTFLESRGPELPGDHIAVHGDASQDIDGIAVQATGGELGYGVKASTHDGVALYGEALQGGRALRTRGRVELEGHAGVVVIAAGRTSATVTAPVYPSSIVTATPMVNLSGRSFWYTKNSRKNTLTFHISSPRNTPTRLTWHMLE